MPNLLKCQGGALMLGLLGGAAMLAASPAGAQRPARTQDRQGLYGRGVQGEPQRDPSLEPLAAIR